MTVFGQSTGAQGVEALLASEHASGYFHKAIAQSGSLNRPTLDNNVQFEELMVFSRKYFNVSNDDELKNALSAASAMDIIQFYKETPARLGTFQIRSSSDDFFPSSFRDLHSFQNNVPYMTGYNSTEAGCLYPILSKAIWPGCTKGWTYDQLLHYFGGGSEAEAKIETLKKIYAPGKSMQSEMSYSRLFLLSVGDNIFVGPCQSRVEEICRNQPVFEYELNVKIQAFHNTASKKMRMDFCRADHGDDLAFVFGLMFDPNLPLTEEISFTDDERRLSKRMMTAWATFARSGKPGWNSFDKETKIIRVFDTPQDSLKSLNDPVEQARLNLWRKTNSHF